MPIFRVKSVKIYTGQFFYTDMSVVSVTNIRHAQDRSYLPTGGDLGLKVNLGLVECMIDPLR